jgi:hypothetical protein
VTLSRNLIRNRDGRIRTLSAPAQDLAEARAADEIPWDRDRLLVYRTIFPQMAGWLPEEEAAHCGSNSTPRWRG